MNYIIGVFIIGGALGLMAGFVAGFILGNAVGRAKYGRDREA